MIEIPERRLLDPEAMARESPKIWQDSWGAVWSLFQRRTEEEFHADDMELSLGGCGALNFHLHLAIQARRLEGNPLSKCAFLYIDRGVRACHLQAPPSPKKKPGRLT